MNVRSENVTRINTRLETFLAKELDVENVEFYDQEPCVEQKIHNLIKIFNKYPYRILIVCKNGIFITDNPPKRENLENFICFDDILEIKTVSFKKIEKLFRDVL